MSRFTGKVAVVTGGASGQGRASALRIAAEGGRVAIVDIADGGGKTIADQINGSVPGAALAIECDVADPAQAEGAVAQALEFGGAIDTLINCAGTGFYRHFHDSVPADVKRIMDVNLWGTFWMCQHAMPSLLESKGTIVNVASVAGMNGVAYLTAYGASKGAVIAFTRTLAVEYGPQFVRANAVCPGAVDTPLLKLFHLPEDADQNLLMRNRGLLGRMATADEVASTITFLASSDSAHMTGAVVTVDAGSSA
jgi:meso-butanediol dehydrogenase/(S,S)-butanediol dehydrogenase/diacetyl reductase